MQRVRARFVAVLAVVGLGSIGGCSSDPLFTNPFGQLLRYEFVEALGDSGSGNGQFFYPQGVTVDRDGRLYVVDTANRRIQKFDAAGDYLTQWGTYGAGSGQFGYMNSLAVDAGGNVYVADAGNSRIQKFSGDGTFLTEWGSLGGGDGQFSDRGLAVALGPDGSVHVLDSGNGRVQKFTGDGAYLTQWGQTGSGNARFLNPRDLAVDGSGNVYVADGRNSVQVFTRSGAFLRRWPMRGENYWAAERLAVADGIVFVTDCQDRSIKLYSREGKFHTRLGLGAESWRWTPAVGVDASGNLYVTDTAHNRVMKYARIRR